VLFKDVKEVRDGFFDGHYLGKNLLAFLPLYAKIFRRFGNQFSEFLTQPEFLGLTSVIVEFFSNLPHCMETEIGFEMMEEIKSHRPDIWSWIGGQFDMVTKGDSYVLTHKLK